MSRIEFPNSPMLVEALLIKPLIVTWGKVGSLVSNQATASPETSTVLQIPAEKPTANRPPLFDREGNRIGIHCDYSSGTFDDHGNWSPLQQEA